MVDERSINILLIYSAVYTYIKTHVKNNAESKGEQIYEKDT